MLILAAGAALLSGAAIWFADGLHPVWWLMWLAPLPVLVVAPRLSRTLTVVAAFLAWAGGHLSLVGYYRAVRIPWAAIATFTALPALLFALSVLLFRSLLLRRRPLAAAVVLPCIWVLVQTISGGANGSYGNLAYTQMDCLPLLQLAAVTGMSGITFFILFVPSALAALAVRRSAPLLAALAVVLVVSLGFGFRRLGTANPDGPTVVVGMAVSDQRQNLRPERPAEAKRLLTEYAGKVTALAARGVRIILLPEMAAEFGDSDIPWLDELYGATARQAHARVLVPILHTTATVRRNEARLYGADGRLEAAYWKHHLVPVLEDGTTPGTELAVLHEPRGTLGIEICRDMDYVPLARRNGAQGVGLLLVPAWDFVVDDWLHGRMAVMRGVENGFHLARVAKQGLMTITDPYGRVHAQQSSGAEPFATLVAPAGLQGVPTLYNRWGEWFAWPVGVLLAVAVFLRFRPAGTTQSE